MSEWISVKDRLPKDEWIAKCGFDSALFLCACYIVYFGGDKDDPIVGFAEYRFDEKLGYIWCYPEGPPNPHRDKITYWMPLPEPPTEDKL